MKKGKYFVGDLCYVIDPVHWDEFFSEQFNKVGKFEEFDFASFTSEFGDGEYESNQKRKFEVDSGTIGCIPIDYLEKYNPSAIIDEKAHIFDFKQDFECEKIQGVICIGFIEIYTAKDNEIELLDHNEDELFFED